MSMPTGSSHMSFTMAALTAAGGFVGYAKKKSVPSLVAGVGIGCLFGVGGFFIMQGRIQLGHQVSLGASVILTGAMAPRAIKTKKIMPAGLLATLGAFSTAYHLKKTLEWSGYN